MTPRDYADVFRRIGSTLPMWNSVYIVIVKLMEREEEKLLQQACVNAGVEIEVDGIVGPNTIKALSMCDPSKLMSEIGVLLLKNKESGEFDISSDDLKDVIMKYLAKAEGMHLHWNKHEKGFTTMYGVYSYSFPKAEPVLLVKRFAKENGFKNITKTNILDVDHSLTVEQRRKLKDSIYKFYLDNFMDEKINIFLGNKSTLSFFSISVNGGMRRGYKSLQSALGVVVDGAFGRGSFNALKKYNGSDKEMNEGMLSYMYQFYAMLAKKKKFKRYFKGWVNRLVSLGFKE